MLIPHALQARCSSALFALGIALSATRPAHAGIVFRDDFENGTANWTLNGGWGSTSIGPHSATKSLTDSPGYNYSSNAKGTATLTVPVDLSNAKAPRMWFWLRYSSESFHDW